MPSYATETLPPGEPPGITWKRPLPSTFDRGGILIAIGIPYDSDTL